MAGRKAKIGKVGGKHQKKSKTKVGKKGISKAGHAMARKFGIDNVRQGRGGSLTG